MSVIRHILPLFRNIFFVSVFLANLNSSIVGNENVLLPPHCLFGGGGVLVGRRDGLYQISLSASNCRENENIFVYPCRKSPYSQAVS
jgi:hypothetical protein